MFAFVTRLLVRLGILATPAQDEYLSWADARLDQLELIRRVAMQPRPQETPRARKIRLAMVAIAARGEQPSPGRIQRELGETVKNGGDLNGRDSRTYAEVMMALGYVRRVGPNGGFRWFGPVV